MTAVALGETTVVLAAAWALDRLAAGRLRPHLRHGLWTLVAIRLLLGLVPPGVIAWPIPAPGTIAMDAAVISAAAAPLPEIPAPWWLAAWALGAVALATRWVIASIRVNRRHEAFTPSAGFAAGRLPAIAGCAGLRRLPAVCIDPAAPAPYVTGLWRTRLVLPSDWDSWPDETLDHAIAHELMHIVRRDLLAEVCWMLLACVYWFHPLAHVARRRAHESREMCCDADVASRLGPAYRTTLLRVIATMVGEDTRAGAPPGRHAWHPALARLHALDRWPAPPPRWHGPAAAVGFVALALLLLPPRVVVHSARPAAGVERLLDPATRQRLGMGSLHLRYALLAAEAQRGAAPQK